MKSLAAAILGVVVVASLAASPFDDGKDAFGRQDWKTAAALLGQFAEQNPDDPQAPSAAFLRAVALYQQGNYRGSLDGFQKLERTWPESAFSHRLPYWKGTAALAAGQPAVAERELTAQGRYPQEELYSTRALLNLGLARVALGKSDRAIEAFQAFLQATKEAPLAAQAWASWADEDRKAGRTDQALVHYRSAWTAYPGDRWDLWSRTQAVDLDLSLHQYSAARTLLDESSAAFPAEEERWDSRKTEVYRGLGDRVALARVLEVRWAREPDPGKKQDLAANRARTAEELGQLDTDWWLKASAGPDEALGAEAIQRYAFWLEGAHKVGPAAQVLDEWTSAHPTPSDPWQQVRSRAAQDHWVAGDLAGARKAWNGLIEEFPQSKQLPVWLLGRGRLALDAGDTVPALADFSRLTKTFPQAPEALEARYQTGLVYLQRKEPARAEAWFYGLVQELKAGDLYQRALLARGVSFVDSGQTDLARGSLQRLIREAPTGPWTGAAWAALGRNALQGRQFDEASAAFGHAEASQTDAAQKAQALWSWAEVKTAQGQPAEASQAYARYATDYPTQPRVAEAQYRRGAVWSGAQNWQTALDTWEQVVRGLKGEFFAQTQEGMATALLRLGRPQEGWDRLEALEKGTPSPEAWYRWGQTATALGEPEWAATAFQTLLERHPDAPVAEAALPRAAGALLGGGHPEEALARYADYFQKFGLQPASAPVARGAAAAAQPFPGTLESLVKASRTWKLAPEVATEFSLAWAQSRLDSDTDAARGELQDLSRTAPWTSQRSEALGILGRWFLARGQLTDARTALEAAATLGDDLSVFKARWALAQVTEKEGDLGSAARQRESAEKAAGPGVPVEFRVQALQEALAAWTKAGKTEDADRVKQRIAALGT